MKVNCSKIFTIAVAVAVWAGSLSFCRAASVSFEAESGALGSNFTNGTSGAVQFISTSTDTVNSGNPGNADRMATYTVTFPAAGTYNLFARVRVGSGGGGANDDSFFYGNGFGVKSATTDGDWITANGLSGWGYTASTDVVTNNGSAGTLVWKWINLSQIVPGGSGAETPITFAMPTGNLTQTFQIGARENGLNIDKFVFGTSDYTFTVNDLDTGGAGTPPPEKTPLRRSISPNQPMWLVHIDTWNYADPQKIIALIPQDIRPYVVMNISLSVSHTTNGQFQVAEYGYEIAKSWVRACAENRMWCMIQPSSGGYSQFSDFDLSVYEEFYRNYPNLIGFNYAEQFWGYDSTTDPLSAAWTDRIAHFANLLKLSQKYGGYLVVSWCGNQFSQNINPIGMLKRNPAFAAACRDYTENFILCEKYTTVSYKSDMESLCLGAYLSGYSGQYGIRYDSSGWTDDTGTNQNFTLASGGAPQLEHMMLTGETVVDAPELIWQQCFQEISAGSTDNGYTMRRFQTFPQFDNVSVDLFRKVLDGTVRIPSRQEVINRTKVVIVNDVNSGSSDAIYSSPDTLFEGLYRMDGDGIYQSNKTFFKKTGRYPTVPTVYLLDDADANSFQVQVNKSAYSTRWPSIASKTSEFNTLFASEYTGDLYAGRHENGWVTYNPYRTNVTASASIPFKYNTCDHMDLTYSKYTSGVIKEYSNSVTFYLCNYDNDLDTGLKTDTIKIYGSTNTPSWSYVERGSHQASNITSNWSGGVFTLTVQHNGSIDITVNCAGTGTGRLTNYTTATLIAPSQPMLFPGPRQYEAECFDYKSISGITKGGSSSSIRNYSGQGYLQFGTSSSASVRDFVTVLKGGTYRLETKYAVTGANISTIDLYVNGAKVATPAFTQTATLSDWAINKQNITLNAGTNTIEFRANGTAASSLYFDNIVVVPIVISDDVVIQENRTGFDSVDGTIDNNYPGYTGDGFANTADTNGASVYWTVDFDSSVIKSFTFRYASTNAGTADLIINGINVATNIQFPSTGAWTNWGYVTIYTYTPAGSSDVRLQATSATGVPNVDYLAVTGGWAGTPPPTGLTAVAVAMNQINLSWIASSNATSYNVKRSLATGGNYTVVATGVTATNFNDIGLVGGTTYYYVVSAVSASGEGSDSAEVNATTLTPTLQPLADAYVESSNPNSNFGTSTNMVVKNNVSLASREAYLMFDVRALTNLLSATLTLVPNRVDDTAVPMYYEVASTNWTENGITWNNRPGGTGVFLATNTVAVGVPVVLDVRSAAASKATNGGLLSIRITQPTNNLNGLVQFCSKEHPTTGWRPVLEYSYQLNTPPTNLVATAGDAQVRLSWDVVPSASSYNVKRSFVSGGPYTTIAPNVTATAYTNTGLANGTRYYYVVSSSNSVSGFESANSAQVSASPAWTTPPNIAERIYALTTENQLIAFNSTGPGTILTAYTVFGLQANEKIVGIDFWNGTLYGLGDQNHLYTLNLANGAAGLVGTFSPPMNGEAFGFEAEPGGLRLVSNLDQHLLLNYGTGAATVGTTINGSPDPRLTGLAYHPGNGQQYAAEYYENTIGLLNPATGLFSTIGLAGIDFSRHSGFEISPNPGNAAYLASPASSSGDAANLYKVDLTTGSTTLVGLIGLAGDDTLIRGLAVGPGFVNLAPTSLSMSASGNQLTLSWPADHVGWTLQCQTNSRSVGLSTVWTPYNGGLADTNSVVIPMGSADGTVFFRLVYP